MLNFINFRSGKIKILQKNTKPIESKMNFLIFQSLKSHMFPNLKNMRTVMFKNFFQMLNPRNTKFRTIPNQLNP